MREYLYEVRLMADENYKREYTRASSNEEAVKDVEDRLNANEYKVISVERMG